MEILSYVLPGHFAGYFQTILTVFLLPPLLLARSFFAGVSKRKVALAVAAVALIGWSWSMTVTAHGWWVFREDLLVGIWLLPHLPLEEVLFYPAGVFFIIGLYNYFDGLFPGRMSRKKGYLLFLYAGTAAFLALAVSQEGEKGHYMYSQLLVFNLICIALSGTVASRFNPRALIMTTAALSIVGGVWDYFGVKYGWWVYDTVLGIGFLNIPVENLNFYLYAPAAGLSIFHLASGGKTRA